MAVNSTVKKRKELPIAEKIEVLMYSKIHNIKSTAAHFGIGLTTVKAIKRREKELLELQEVIETKASSKRFRRSRFTNIATQTWKWVQETMKNGERITNRLIKEKAISFAHDAGILNFSASNGWFQSFRDHYGYVSPRSRSKCNTEMNEKKPDAVYLTKEKYNVRSLDEDDNFHTGTAEEDSDYVLQEKDSGEIMTDSRVNDNSPDLENVNSFGCDNLEKKVRIEEEYKTQNSTAEKTESNPCTNSIEIIGSCDLEEMIELNQENKTKRLSTGEPEHIVCNKEKEVNNCVSKEINLNQVYKLEISSATVEPKMVPCLKQKNGNIWKRARTQEEIALLIPKKRILEDERKRKDIQKKLNKEVKKKRNKTSYEVAFSNSRHNVYLDLFF